ncbi:MAG: hypothetical protein R3345_12000 [Fulvivirga sp.]|nr:hypothetical protein [Fulvivirga sp.]
MVEVKLRNTNLTASERLVAKTLQDSIKRDVATLQCDCCDQDSQIILNVDNSKMFAVRTDLKSCCSQFEKVIASHLYEEVAV